MLDSYEALPIPTAVKNPQANCVEIIHQTLGNMIRTFELEDMDIEEKDPFTQILSNCAWAIRSTIHAVMEATPAQLVFGRDMLFNIAYTIPWKEVAAKRSRAAKLGNKRENSKRTKYTYEVGQKTLLDKGKVQRKVIPKRNDTFTIVRVHDNGTLKIQKGNVLQTVTIRRCTPYFE
ncbi:hypothetical protein ACHAWF_006846 [Thalassiosira exigua]